MNSQDAQTIVAIAMLAATADGQQSEAERADIAGVATRLGLDMNDEMLARAAKGEADLTALAQSLSSDEVRLVAYDTAAAVCHADGIPNASESAFLTRLSQLLGAGSPTPQAAASFDAAAAAASGKGASAAPSDVDNFILDQAMLTAACALLPDRLSGMAIVPLQLRMAYSIGQRHGQQFDMAQIKDLTAVLGIGAAGHVVEGVIRGFARGIGRGVLGGLLGGTAGMAAGALTTFATSYALGHAVEQYYAQGRKLSTQDLRALFERFKGEANTIYPRVEGRIHQLSSTTSLSSVLSGLRH
jgi:uncharacterized protein (DUF697 family)/tellurite resistance protein